MLELGQLESERLAYLFDVRERKRQFIPQPLAHVVPGHPGSLSQRLMADPVALDDLANMRGKSACEWSGDRLFSAGHAHDAIRP